MSLHRKTYPLLALSAVLLAGCGQTGPLFHEDGNSEAAVKHRERQAYLIEAEKAEAAMAARKAAESKASAEAAPEPASDSNP